VEPFEEWSSVMSEIQIQVPAGGPGHDAPGATA
jgi:hypothetical protein